MSRTRRPPVPESVVQRIQALILSGQLDRGRLPSERRLAEQLGVSRASLRAALSVLATVGLIRIEPWRGTFVVDYGGHSGTVVPMPIWRFGNRYTLREVYQLRHLNEGYAARLAAMAVTDDEVAALQKILHAHKEATRTLDFVMSSQADFDLHHRIMVLAKNRILPDLHQNYRTLFLESQRLPMARHERLWEPALEHEKIVHAIGQHDPDGAEYYMRLHITRAAERVGIELSDTPCGGAASGDAPAPPTAAMRKGK